MDSPFLTKEEAAEYLRLSPKSLSRLSIPRIKVGRLVRYERSDLDAYMSKQKQIGGVRLGRSYHRPVVVNKKTSAERSDLGPLFAV